MITFIGALEKGLSFYIGVGLKKRIHSRDYKILARAIFNYGIHENCMMSSSMDFAKENGFRTNDGGRKLLNRAIRFQNKVVNEIKRNTDPHTTVADIWYNYTT